jgi:hypothetical protein
LSDWSRSIPSILIKLLSGALCRRRQSLHTDRGSHEKKPARSPSPNHDPFQAVSGSLAVKSEHLVVRNHLLSDEIRSPASLSTGVGTDKCTRKS